MEAVFTIVAKNYIPLANVLGNSIRLHHPDLAFFVVVADKADGLIDFSKQQYPIIPAEELGLSNFLEMAFKYNVTEFCTALKPFAFSYLFAKGFDKVLYFDPDIYIFKPLDHLFVSLSTSSMVLTPHYQTPEIAYSGLFREGNILFAGIFNLGFCGLRAGGNGTAIVNWWGERLKDQCFADRTDGLHVDQKWVDFIPTLFTDIHIERSLAYNIAVWNWHERKLSFHDNTFWVSNRITGSDEEPVVFYHYSNYRFKFAADYKQFVPIHKNRFADIEAISSVYADLLIKEDIANQLTKLTYSFATFDNGTGILQFHRRFYRQLVENGSNIGNPFQTASSSSFFNRLKANGLITANNASDKLNETNFDGFDRKLRLLNRFARVAKSVLGFERYALLCKFMFRYVRAENQAFLMQSDSDDVYFVNENRYINVDK